MAEFTGRTVLITGASGGLGSPVTSAFLKAGYRVAGVARSWKKDKIPDEHFLALEADVTTAAACEFVVHSVIEAWQSIDVAIHIMGGFAADGPVQTSSEETWDRMMNMNAKSGFLFFRAVLPSMLSRSSGRLIAVGSRAGVTPSAGTSAYSASKAALHALILALGEELRHTGITANAILPGTIDTAANRAAMPAADSSKWVPPESLASLLVYLASPEAAHINGSLIPIYGRS